jgi:hypothetical protein
MNIWRFTALCTQVPRGQTPLKIIALHFATIVRVLLPLLFIILQQFFRSMHDYGRLVKELCDQTTLSDGKFCVYISKPARTADRHLKNKQYITIFCIHTVVPPDDGTWIRRKHVQMFDDKYTDNKLASCWFFFTQLSDGNLHGFMCISWHNSNK